MYWLISRLQSWLDKSSLKALVDHLPSVPSLELKKLTFSFIYYTLYLPLWLYLEVSWIFKDGRSSTDGRPSRQFNLDIFQVTLLSLDLFKEIDGADKLCPEFNTDSSIRVHWYDFYWYIFCWYDTNNIFYYYYIEAYSYNSYIILQMRNDHYCSQLELVNIIKWHKTTAWNSSKPIPQRIEQRLRKLKCANIVKDIKKLAADLKLFGLCCVCLWTIKDVLFQCSQCERDYGTAFVALV